MSQGLQYRFPEKVRLQWVDHYECMMCGKNQWDCLHHIVSPSSRFHKPGDHNKSVFNSCPIHNFAHPVDAMSPEGVEHYCHFGNEGFLHKDHVVAWLLQKTYRTLMRNGYEMNDRDKQFLFTYAALYLMDVSDPTQEATEISGKPCAYPVDNLSISA